MMDTEGTRGVRWRWSEAAHILRTALHETLAPCGFEDVVEDQAVELTRDRLPDARHGITVRVYGAERPMFCPSVWVGCPLVETLLQRIGIHRGAQVVWSLHELSADGSAWEFLEPAPDQTERVSRGLAAFLALSIAPRLDKYWNLGAFRDAYSDRAAGGISCLVLAALKHAMGEKPAARRILQEFIARSHMPPRADQTLYPEHSTDEFYIKPKARALLALIEGTV